MYDTLISLREEHQWNDQSVTFVSRWHHNVLLKHEINTDNVDLPLPSDNIWTTTQIYCAALHYVSLHIENTACIKVACMDVYYSPAIICERRRALFSTSTLLIDEYIKQWDETLFPSNSGEGAIIDVRHTLFTCPVFSTYIIGVCMRLLPYSQIVTFSQDCEYGIFQMELKSLTQSTSRNILRCILTII